jgi:D-beta-D-heptose 7-phosphate kinase/D-beta-D-heptose 1-phosphate adenosyltransferase
MKQIINYLKTCGPKEIIVIGDVMLDEYWFGSVTRVSPEAPVPVLKQENKEWCLGGAANVAANCKHIGFKVSLVGVIGAHDDEGHRLATMLRDVGIDSNGLVKSEHRGTTCKKRMMVKGHQLLRIDAEQTQTLDQQETSALIKSIDANLKPGTTVLVSDYAKGVASGEVLAYIVQKAQTLGCLVLVDPKGPDFNKYAHVHFMKPNLKEFNHMVSYWGLPLDSSFVENGQKICRNLSLRGLFVTLGEHGIHYISEQESHYCPVFKREVYDITGAGDTVFAFLALALSNGLSVEHCLQVANRAAAVAVSHLKTYAVSLDELIDRESETGEKIFYDWTRLKIELDWLRRGGKRVVFTNGCFDLLHSGHIHLLKEAKRMGDLLVVALNSDESVRRLGKGPGRPINQLEERATLVAALGMVDFVVSFDQDTPKELIEYLSPDVLVKGGDYKVESIVGYDYIKSLGGSVKVIDYVPGRSTTNVMKKIETIQKEVCLS